MDILMMGLADLVAIGTLCTLYMIRHKTRELMISYAVINAGVFTVTVALAHAGSTAGAMGLGLFGVLSIIRLRSTSLSQREVGYYFVSLALGLISGVRLDPPYIAFILMAVLVGIIAVLDSSFFEAKDQPRTQTVTVDRAISDEGTLKAYLESRLGYEVVSAKILELDLLNDTTQVTITYKELPQLQEHLNANYEYYAS